MPRLTRSSLAAALVLAAAVAVACGGDAPEDDRVTLVLAAYTTPREAYGRDILPAFRRYWQERTGQDVVFQESYQGSGAQSRAVVDGFEADVVALSLEPDIDRIADAGLITHDWRDRPHRGIVSTSVVVLAVRPGNPTGIDDWADLARSGVDVLTPDPKTSGGAQWNINAMYGAALRGFAGVPRGEPEAAEGFLRDVFRNVSIMDKGARESITTFERGVGDVAVTYENEVLVAREAGRTYDYVVPRSTILIENPVAVVDVVAERHGVREVADAFVAFLWSDTAQRAYARHGLRPVNERVAQEVSATFPPVEDLWRIDALGGWDVAAETLYGPEGRFTRAFGAAAAR